MKKYLAIAMCALLVVTGCGSKDSELKNHNETKPNVENKDTGSNVENKNTDSTNDNKTGSNTENTENGLEQFVDMMKPQIESQSNSVFDIKLEARNNSLVYVYKYKETYSSLQMNSMKKSLETSMKSSASVFENVLSQVKGLYSDTKSVIVEYYNNDNTLIYSIEFK